MPGLLSSIQRFDLSTGISEDVWAILYANAARANLILPHAEKVFGRQRFTPKISSTEQLWLVYLNPRTSEIQFILSLTTGPQAKYPLFIVPTVPIAELTPKFLKSPMEALCNALLNESGFRKQRVFSAFSVEPVTEAFALAWEKFTGIARIKEPYYSSIYSTCTKSTLVRQQRAPRPSEDVALAPRLASEQDVEQMTVLCQEFAATSPPFVLSTEKSREEAMLLIANKQVWVHEIQKPNRKPEIATIVAVTRKSKDVAAITKVYTPEKWRGRGCAERLVRHVCIELLEKYEELVLYVGVDNSAKEVYSRVGFQDLRPGSASERWLELGFDQAKVELGHW
ncbi:hypothetical protein DEU56DRAFT_313931 [Suillus clintonianus]|uniref:uncharacterized protein n=1 Tax=Suillus clintonianus TaxID=1904413 RepID=UPI001B86E230|nr:uncharacterized protein DEU56DRAFT_313931 [Suillus clintonianus]KAG2155561.1 hypothetical protein DEU56DRAFT_313931 [Suillus clintonianus]